MRLMTILCHVSKATRLIHLGLILCCLCLPIKSLAQEQTTSDSSLIAMFDELDELFLEEDSIGDLLLMVDSLLSIEDAKVSSMHMRLSYISQVTNAGRSLDVNQFGISPGLTFYHHTGLFADLSGFFNSDYDPSYYITKATVGYFHTIKDVLTNSISHDFYFFNDSLSTHSFDKSVQLSSFLNYKILNLGVDYSYLYGNKTAHRLTGDIGFDFKFNKVWIFDKITLYPGFSVQYGNADVVFIRQSEQPFRDLYTIMTTDNYPELSNTEFYRLGTLLKNERVPLATKYLIDRGFTLQQISIISDAYYGNQIKDENVYGIMNYAFALPIAFTLNSKLSVIMGYTYNIPVRLPNESYTLDQNGFFNLSVAYKFYYVK